MVAQKSNESVVALSAPADRPANTVGGDLNGLLLAMLLEMEKQGNGLIRPEATLYLARQISERSGGRIRGIRSTDLARKVSEFVGEKQWLAAQTHGYTLTPSGRRVAEVWRRREKR